MQELNIFNFIRSGIYLFCNRCLSFCITVRASIFLLLMSSVAFKVLLRYLQCFQLLLLSLDISWHSVFDSALL